MPPTQVPPCFDAAASCSSLSHQEGTRNLTRMAYDEELAERVRELVSAEAGLSEKKMFGGLAFLLHGNMAVAASGQGGLLVRVDPAEGEDLVATTPAEPMEMQGRAMAGWLRVDADTVRTKKDLTTWVRRGTTYAKTLPAKKS